MKIEILLAPRFFQPMETGELTFHVYSDMGPVQKGDVCVFREYDFPASFLQSQRFTGKTLEREVTWVQPLRGEHGLVQVLSLKPVRKSPTICWKQIGEEKILGKCSLGDFVIEKYSPVGSSRNVVVSKTPFETRGWAFYTFEEAKRGCEEALSNGRR